MPLNLKALIRFRVINRCLKDFEYSSLEDLQSACARALGVNNLHPRTIEGDIHEMRHNKLLGYNAPIEFDRYRKMYYYDDDNYSIDKLPLQNDEINSILVAAKLLDQLKGVEIFSHFSASARKIAEIADIYRQFDETTLKNAIEFEKAFETRGTEYISPVVDAIKEKYALNLKYKSFTSETVSETLVHPYLIKEYRNRWYMVGLNSRNSGIRTYCLDRFQEKPEKALNVPFLETGFNPKTYFANVIGITVPEDEAVEIEISFSENQANYITTQPLHKSQEKIREEDERIVFRYRLKPNFEFLSYIMGLGKEAEVLSPKSIRTKIRKMYAEAGERYK
ncbi:MAG: helix-turn-helix transcriptional regulator [Methanosarcina sp.]